jgi:hypothetical protein
VIKNNKNAKKKLFFVIFCVEEIHCNLSVNYIVQYLDEWGICDLLLWITAKFDHKLLCE